MCVLVCDVCMYGLQSSRNFNVVYNETEWMTMKIEIQSHQKCRLLLFVDDDSRRTHFHGIKFIYAAQIHLRQRLTFIDLV